MPSGELLTPPSKLVMYVFPLPSCALHVSFNPKKRAAISFFSASERDSLNPKWTMWMIGMLVGDIEMNELPCPVLFCSEKEEKQH